LYHFLVWTLITRRPIGRQQKSENGVAAPKLYTESGSKNVVGYLMGQPTLNPKPKPQPAAAKFRGVATAAAAWRSQIGSAAPVMIRSVICQGAFAFQKTFLHAALRAVGANARTLLEILSVAQVRSSGKLARIG
jgi:hypothetical protein